MNPLDTTLLDQLNFTALDISDRKKLFGIDTACEERLRGWHDFIARDLDDVVKAFYEVIVANEESALLIADADTFGRLRLAQRRYILELFSGTYDLDYVNNRLRVGLVHKRIGVTPKLYLSAINTLIDLLQGRLASRVAGEPEEEAVLRDVERIVFFDVSLAMDMYVAGFVQEIDVERSKAVRYAKSLEKQVEERTRELEMAARRDELTGMLNRRAFDGVAHRELARSRRVGQPASLIYIDMDDFKAINDNEGHARGDEVLRTLGKKVREILRETDYAFRMGGDEFCVLLVDTGAPGAERFMERLEGAWKKVYPDYAFSTGITVAEPEEERPVEDLLEEADRRMYRDKQADEGERGGEAAGGTG